MFAQSTFVEKRYSLLSSFHIASIDIMRMFMYNSRMEHCRYSSSSEASGKSRATIYRETRFRQPSVVERSLAFWVDRMGSGGGAYKPNGPLRLLGQYAVVAVERGHGVFFSPTTGRIKLVEGDALLLFPEEPTAYGGDPNWETRWIVWNGLETERIIQHGGLTPTQPVIRQGRIAITRAFVALEGILHAEDFPAMLERKRVILGLLADLLKIRRNAATHDVIATLIESLDAGEGRPPAVSALAARCHLSLSQFRRRFYAHTGWSPVAFLTAQRIAKAKALLIQGLPMKEVARLTGYADVFHFMRVFRYVSGQTVGQFIASENNGDL